MCVCSCASACISLCLALKIFSLLFIFIVSEYILKWFTPDYLDPSLESMCTFCIHQQNWKWEQTRAHDRTRKIDEWIEIYLQTKSWRRKNLRDLVYKSLLFFRKKQRKNESLFSTLRKKMRIKSKSRLGRWECETCWYNCDFSAINC